MTANGSTCIFADEFVKTIVDPRIKADFEAAGKKANFGDLRAIWKREHHRRVAPYDDCPFTHQECAIAFYSAVRRVVSADKPGALFRYIARSDGIERSENKPSWGDPSVSRKGEAAGPVRSMVAERDAVGGRWPQDDDVVGDHVAEQRYLRRRHARPLRIGEMQRPDNPGPRERTDHLWEEST